MNRILIDSPRLQLREFTAADVEFVVELVNSPGWLEFIGDRQIHTKDDAWNYLTNGPIKSYRENGFGLYLVETKKELTRIGMCGMLKRESLRYPDVGFAFLPTYTGFGYALESAAAVVEYALRQLRIPKIGAITRPTNERSIRLLEKLGMRRTGAMMVDVEGQELFVFELEAGAHPIDRYG